MKLELKAPSGAIVKIFPEYNNTVCIYNKKNSLEFIVIPVKRGVGNGKD